MLTIHESTSGGVQLRLTAAAAGATTELRIEREERLAHKTLQWEVLKVNGPTAGIRPIARLMTRIACELDRLHGRGYGLRQRAGGGLRGAWRMDLLAPTAARPAVSWEVKPRRPEAELTKLAERLATLDVPCYTSTEPDQALDYLATALREEGREIRRRHEIDAFVAADPALPADEFIEALNARGLLDAAE